MVPTCEHARVPAVRVVRVSPRFHDLEQPSPSVETVPILVRRVLFHSRSFFPTSPFPDPPIPACQDRHVTSLSVLYDHTPVCV